MAWFICGGLIVGCEQSKTGIETMPVVIADRSSADVSVVDENALCRIKGRIAFTGELPQLPPLVRHGMSPVDPTVCAALGDIPDESLVVSAGDRGVANVYVWLPRKLNKVPSESPGVVVPIHFDGCRVSPRAVIGRTVDEFWFEFRDPTAHNLRLNPRHNATQCNNPGPNSTDKLKFKTSEKQPFEFQCAIHAWMGGSLLVLDHSYAAVTGEDGSFLIANLPPGDHELHLWHERDFRDQLKVNLKAGDEVDVGVIFLTLNDAARLTRHVTE